MRVWLCLYLCFSLFLVRCESFRGKKIDGLFQRNQGRNESITKLLRNTALKQSIIDNDANYPRVPIVAEEVVQSSGKSTLATIFGYIIGAGSLTLYLPILVDIVKRGNTNGVAIQTWIANAASFSLALIYPVKKRFALSTYVELLALAVQSIIILTTICFYNGLVKEFATVATLVASLMYLVFTKEIPDKALSSIQVCRVTLDTFTLLPQILLNFRAKSFRYSLITLGMSIIGNLMRVFTTVQLLKDNLVLAGYLFGLLNAFILLAQYFTYGAA